jgi:DNA processing protein
MGFRVFKDSMHDIISEIAMAGNGTSHTNLHNMDLLVNNKKYFIALNRISHIGPRTVTKLLARWPDLEEMFQLSANELLLAGVTPKIAEAIASFDLAKIEADLRWQEASNHFLLTWSDPEYPALLKEIHDPPVVLYAIGQLSSLQQRTVSIVGTRNPSLAGSKIAHQFAFELAKKGIAIVSGLALGIDAQAHRGCLEARGQTIAVMGTGIDCIYPRRHEQLAEQITQNGLLMSELPLQSSPEAGHFPRRNRIISGLSSSTLVVEAAIRSGSLITARLACEQNRDVLAVPGSIHNPQARGCHYLLQQGAKLVTSSDDVLDELKVGYETVTVENVHKVLAGDDQNLVKCIGFETTHVDQIMECCGMSLEKVVCELAELELQGIVTAVSGGYTRCMV